MGPPFLLPKGKKDRCGCRHWKSGLRRLLSLLSLAWAMTSSAFSNPAIRLGASTNEVAFQFQFLIGGGRHDPDDNVGFPNFDRNIPLRIDARCTVETNNPLTTQTFNAFAKQTTADHTPIEHDRGVWRTRFGKAFGREVVTDGIADNQHTFRAFRRRIDHDRLRRNRIRCLRAVRLGNVSRSDTNQRCRGHCDRNGRARPHPPRSELASANRAFNTPI